MSDHADGGRVALAPLYRVLRKRLAGVPYLGVNAKRLLARAKEHVRGEASAGLAQIEVALDDLDALEPRARAEVLGRLRAQLKGLKRDGRPTSRRNSRQSRDAEAVEAPLAPLEWSTDLTAAAVGQDVAAAAARHGIPSVAHLLWRPPAAVRVYAPVLGAGSAEADGVLALGGRVVRRWTRCLPGGQRVSALRLRGSADVDVLLRTPVGVEGVDVVAPLDGRLVFGGTLNRALDGGALATLTESEPVVPAQGRAVAIDSGFGPDEDVLGPLRDRLIDGDEVATAEAVPPYLLRRHGLPPQREALEAAHRRGMGLDAARRRLSLDEQLVVQIPASLRRFQVQRGRAATFAVNHTGEARLIASGRLDALGASQREAFDDIKRDLLAPNTTQRVLCGAPEAEPEAVALYAVLAVAAAKAQVLVVASEPSTAIWLHQLWEPALRDLGIEPLLLDSEPTRSEVDRLRKGDLGVVFGASAALGAGLEWRRLGLILVAEQRDYGALFARAVGYRAAAHPVDVLGLSRAPLPWRCLQRAYPSADVSVVRPPGDLPAAGRVWSDPLREAAFRALSEQVQAGRQGLVMLPLGRSGADLVDVRDAVSIGQTMQEQFFPGARVGVLHGAHSVAERQRVVREFLQRRVDVLVSTTTVELHGRLPRGVVALLELADGFDVERLLGVRALVGPEGEVHYVLRTSPSSRAQRIIRALAERVPAEAIAADHADAFTPAPPDGAPSVEPLLPWTRVLVAEDAAAAVALLAEARAVIHAALRVDPSLRQPAQAELLRLAHALWPVVHGAVCPLAAPPTRAQSTGRRRRRRRSR